MDYMINPLICIIWCSQQAAKFSGATPYAVWAALFLHAVHGPQPARRQDVSALQHHSDRRPWSW